MVKNNKIKICLLTLSICILIFNLLFVLTSCDINVQVNDYLLPNVIVICVHVFSTILLIIFSVWLVWTPTKNSIDKRREYIEKTLVEAENAKKESFQRLIEAENKRMEAYEEAQKIIDNSNLESNYKFDAIVNKAKSDAISIQKNANEEAKKLLKDLNQTNNKKIVDIAMLASKEILKRNINKKDNEKIVNNFIKNFKRENKA